ncbi:metallopeptidase family protein [Patescibacteria group bacterium]|nr:metallopeptidase family protein [Patescibacteria group bacterium]MBU4162127.1 metallopeptidase family protein [Patescibacteria group bacterium]
MRQEDFEELVRQGIAEIPEKFRDKMKNVDILVEDWPSPEQLRQARVPTGGLLFGLYQGIPQTKRGAFYANVLPDKITLFQGSIETVAKTPEEIKEKVKRTVWHEIAHHFGMSEKEVRDLEKKKFK